MGQHSPNLAIRQLDSSLIGRRVSKRHKQGTILDFREWDRKVQVEWTHANGIPVRMSTTWLSADDVKFVNPPRNTETMDHIQKATNYGNLRPDPHAPKVSTAPHVSLPDPTWGKWVLPQDLDKTGRNAPERILLMEYSLRDLELISERAHRCVSTDPSVETKARKLISKIEEEIDRRVMLMIEEVNN